MKARLYVDVEVNEKQFLNGPLLQGTTVGDDPNQPRADAQFEGMRYLSWVLSEYLDAKKPVGYEGPKVFIKELHAKHVYPDPAGTIIFGEEKKEDGTKRPKRSVEQHSTSNSRPTETQ